MRGKLLSRLLSGQVAGRVGLCSLLASAPAGEGQHVDPTNALVMRMRVEQSTTKAYRAAALTALLDDVNRFARDMGLPEKLPITASNVVTYTVRPPAISEIQGHFGSLATRDYHYWASLDNKLCYIEAKDGSELVGTAYLSAIKEKYRNAPIPLNTNAAYALATQWLAAASVDVSALEADCKPEVRPQKFSGQPIPIYWVWWKQPDSSPLQTPRGPEDTVDTVVTVALVEPDRRLLQMRIENPRYIRRARLTLPERDRLLQESDDLAVRRFWFTSQAYKSAALKVMLQELNELARGLSLEPTLPIYASNLTDILVSTPYVADRLENFGRIATEKYCYYYALGDKLSTVHINLNYCDYNRLFASMKARYALPKSQMNTNAPYRLARQWLEALSVDVSAMERDLRVRVEEWDLGTEFVPFYTVVWGTGRDNPLNDAAHVELLEPEKLLTLLSIMKPKYIKRPPLSVPNREALLSTSASRGAP